MKKISAIFLFTLISLFSMQASYADCTNSGGFCSGSVNDGFTITRGVSTGSINLATTAEVPSYDVVGAPDPTISWGDMTSSTASSHATPFFGCIQCILSGVHTYQNAGDYTVSITYYTGAAVSYTTSFVVTIEDPTVVIGSIGDSVFSGEGNPDVNQQWAFEGLFPDYPEAIIPGADAVWGETPNDEECHRSSFAPANLVRNMLEQQNPSVNYSLENLACTGGTIGAAGDQAENLSDDVDLLVMSAGANNIGGGFSNIFGACLQQGGDCGAHPSWGDIVASTDGLIPGIPDSTEGYVDLNRRIVERGIPGLSPRDIFITEYYDPTRGANGNFGSGNCMLDGDLEFFVDVVIPFINFFQSDEDDWISPDKWEWDSSTWELLYNTIVVSLNNNIALASDLFGWNYVGGIEEAYRRHGMCAFEHGGQPWVRGFNVSGTAILSPFLESFRVQGDVTGSLHPNHDGALAIAEHIVRNVNYTRTPSTEIKKDRFIPVSNQINIVQDTDFLFGAIADQNFPTSSGLGETYYYLEPTGSVSGDCHPGSQSACTLASASGFGIQVTGGGSWEVGYFSCNKWNSELKSKIFPSGHPRAGETMEGVGCEDIQTLTVSMTTPTQLNLTYPSGEPYQEGDWSREPILAELATTFLGMVTSYYSISDDLQDMSCSAPSGGTAFGSTCNSYSTPFQIAQEGNNYLTYFSLGSLVSGNPELIDPRELVALVNLDRIPPEIGIPSVMPFPNIYGWNNEDVIVSWPCTDVGSGPIESPVVAQSMQEGRNQILGMSCTDQAGNDSAFRDQFVNIDKTAPQASSNVSRGNDSQGWYNRLFTVSWLGSDALSGIDECRPPIDYSGPDTAAGNIGGVCLDKAGNLSNPSDIQFKYDGTLPVVSPLPSRSANSAGWYNRAFTVNWPGTDNLSGIASCSADAQVTGPDTNAGQVQGQCADIAGNQSLVATYDFKFDATVPALSPAPNRAPDSNGWYNHGFTVSWPGTDNISGIASCSTQQDFSGPDTNNGLLQGSCTDIADNDTGAVDFHFLYDATIPTISYLGNVGTYSVIDMVNIVCVAEDNLSGVETDTCTNISGPAYGFAVGINQFAAQAGDVAGNQGSGQTSFELRVEHDDLATLLCSFVSKSGICNSLGKKLENIKAAVESGRSRQVDNLLRAFVNELEAQRDKAITSENADTLLRLMSGLPR